MALPACTLCEKNEGIYLGTNLADGDTQTVCGACIVPYALGMAAAVTQGMEQHEAAQYLDVFAAIAANLGQQLPKTGKPKRARPSPRPAADMPPGGSRSDAAAVVALPDPCAQCGSLEGLGDAEKLTCRMC